MVATSRRRENRAAAELASNIRRSQPRASDTLVAIIAHQPDRAVGL
jgi:hypothetical protein